MRVLRWIAGLSSEARRAAGASAAVVGLLLAGYALRVWGSGFGLPAYVYHPDEPEMVERAFNILRSGNLNPGWFHYPSGYIYALAASFGVHFLAGATRGFFIFFPEQTPPDFYWIGRVTTAVFGAITILAVYLLGRQVGRRRSGLIAASMLACSYLSVVNAHYATADVPAGLWTTLCALFSVLIVKRKATLWYVLGGLAAGFAAGTKYHAGLCVTLLLVAHMASTRWGEWGWLNGRLLAGLFSAAGAFFLTTPYALLDLRAFLDGLGFELFYANNAYHPGYTGQSGLWYVHSLFGSADAPLAAVYVAGLIFALVQPRRERVVLFVFPALYVAGLFQSAVHFERYLLPIIPILSVLAALCVDAAAGELARRLRGDTLAWAAGLTALVVALPLTTSALFDMAIAPVQVRAETGAWIAANVPAGSKIAVEQYGVPLPAGRYQVANVVRLWDHDAGWYVRQGFDYVVASNGVWVTLLRPGAHYPEETTVLMELRRQHTLAAEFKSEPPPPLVTAGYSTIAEYHFPSLWVFRLVLPILGPTPRPASNQ